MHVYTHTDTHTLTHTDRIGTTRKQYILCGWFMEVPREQGERDGRIIFLYIKIDAIAGWELVELGTRTSELWMRRAGKGNLFMAKCINVYLLQ